MDAPPEQRMTVAEFLKWQETQELRYELVAGIPVLHVKSPDETDPRMMTRATQPHLLIAGNVDRALGNALQEGTCESYQSDAAVRTDDEQLRYPDVVVDCPDEIEDLAEVRNPVVVFEVLSRSTRQFDLRQKLTEYKRVPSIQTIVFIEQEFVEVEAHLRVEGDAWRTVRHIDLADTLALPALDVEIALDVIYRRVPLDERPRPKPYLAMVQ